jgi:hypothetical protein
MCRLQCNIRHRVVMRRSLLPELGAKFARCNWQDVSDRIVTPGRPHQYYAYVNPW